MKLLAPAKVNLFLEVTKRRVDGYHSISSLMHEIDWCDEIVIKSASSDISLQCKGLKLSNDENNIVFRAAQALKKACNVKKGAKITLFKNIPMGAGLGGGSSDAAAVLKGLIKLWKISISQKKLQNIAKKLGADVPFFLFGGTARVGGIGERIFPIKCKKPLYFVLVYPKISIPTAGVYKRLKFPLTNKRKINTIVSQLGSFIYPDIIGSLMFNRLEEVVLKYHPKLVQIKKIFVRQGAPCLMSGSGSTIFGVVSSKQEAFRLAHKLRNRLWTIKVARSK